MARARLILQGPPMVTLINGLVRQFMPIAGKRIMFTARKKIGHDQPNWPSLAPSTIRKKRGSLRRMGKRAPWIRATSGSAENPLLDTGAMANSIKHTEGHPSSMSSIVTHASPFTTSITADFPLAQHEQDPQVGAFNIASGTPLPARPLLWPSLMESIDPLTKELEDYVGSRI